MITVRALTGAALAEALPEVARLRIAVFRDWPYLYDGDLAYEEQYLQVYRDAPKAVVVGAYDGTRLVGVATGAPLRDHATEFAAPLAGSGVALEDCYYCAESVLLPQARGQGIGHRFFDLREAQARGLGYRDMIFASVLRPDEHPLRPAKARAHDAFWRGRGYAPLPGAVASFFWRDIGEPAETAHPLQIWHRRLT